MGPIGGKQPKWHRSIQNFKNLGAKHHLLFWHGNPLYYGDVAKSLRSVEIQTLGRCAGAICMKPADIDATDVSLPLY